MKHTIFCFALCFLMTGDAASQTAGNLITANSAGKVMLGMTVAQVRRAVAPMKLTRTSDGEGVALIQVKRGRANVMTIYAGEEDRDAQINENARIEQIWVLDRTYKTAAGVRPGMLLASAEKKYGGLKTIVMSEIESREFGEFANHPSGIDFRLRGKNDTAGDYAAGARTTSSPKPGAYIFSINVTGRDRPVTSNTSGSGPVFSSTYTDLKTGCETVGGNEGGHVSTFCKGPAGYQIHYFDSATTLEFNAENEDDDFVVRLASEALDYIERNRKIEWRLADGKPFAVIMRVFTYPAGGEFPKQAKPTGSFLLIKGLKGFESIDGKVDAAKANANEKARETADSAHKKQTAGMDTGDNENAASSTRLYFSDGSTKTIARGRLGDINDKLNYVINAKAGSRLNVRIDSERWDGDEGPVMIGIVTGPDGSGGGGPGGTVFDEVLAQDGDYEIVIRQNAAKSRAENVEFILIVSLVRKDN